MYVMGLVVYMNSYAIIRNKRILQIMQFIIWNIEAFLLTHYPTSPLGINNIFILSIHSNLAFVLRTLAISVLLICIRRSF